MIIDKYGLLGLERTAISTSRVIGLALVADRAWVVTHLAAGSNGHTMSTRNSSLFPPPRPQAGVLARVGLS